MNDTLDPYELLGIPRDANAQTIEAARRRLAAALHPDARPDQPEEVRQHLETLLKRINAAADSALANLASALGEARAPTHRPETRSLPCPWCREWSRQQDLEGEDDLVACPSCGGTFPATVGALALTQFASPAYDLVQFEIRSPNRLFQFVGPVAVHLADGDEFSIVYNGVHRPWALVNHSVGDRSWQLGTPEPSALGELNVGRVATALVAWLVALFLAIEGAGAAASAMRTLLVLAVLCPLVAARWKGRSRLRWLLLSLMTFGAGGFVLMIARGRESSGHDAPFFRVWVPLGGAAIMGALGVGVVATGGSPLWLIVAGGLSVVGARNAGILRGGVS